MDLNLLVLDYICEKESCRKEFGDISRLKELRNQIEMETLRLCYYYPQRNCGLKEEDAGEFALSVIDKLDYILEKYNPEISSFTWYMKTVFKNCVRQFYSNRKNAANKESAVIRDHESYERKLVVSEEQKLLFEPQEKMKQTDSYRKKLLYLFKRSAILHKRFFISALSFMPFMSESTVKDLCRLFRFDTRETIRLCNILSNECSDILTEIERMEERNNFYWSRIIELENEIAADSSFGFYNGDDKTLLSRLESNRRAHLNKIKELQEKKNRVPYARIAEILGIDKHYVDKAVFFNRSLLNMVIYGTDEGKFGNLMKAINSGKWKTGFKYEDLPILVPSEAFDIKMFTHRAK